MDPITNTNDGAEVTATPVEGTTEATVAPVPETPATEVETEASATPIVAKETPVVETTEAPAVAE